MAIVVALIISSAATLKAENIETFYKNAYTPYTQTMHRVFEKLSKGDYTSAWQDQQALEDQIDNNRDAYEKALYPLYDLSQALFMIRSHKAGISIKQDAWDAIQIVRNVYVRGTEIEQANSFLGDDNIELSLDIIKRMVEKKLIDDTKKENTVEGYQMLMSVLDAGSPSYKEAQNQLATLEFENTCSTVQGCRNFLKNYPESPLVNKAKDKLLKYDFENAQKVNDEKTWKKFINDYQYASNASEYLAQAKAALKTEQTEQLSNKEMTLAELDEYASTHKRELDNPVFVIYDNLINLPMQSYRFLSVKMGFNGYCGAVEEVVKETTGNTFTNKFRFNQQGLLEEYYNGRTKTLTKYTYAFDKKKGYYPKSKIVDNKTYLYTVTYDNSGRLASLRCADGSNTTFKFDENGRITERTDKSSAKTVVSTYNKGKIRTEKTGATTLTFLNYDGYRATEIDSDNGKEKHTWNYEFTNDSKNRWTNANAKLDGKLRITITRKY